MYEQIAGYALKEEYHCASFASKENMLVLSSKTGRIVVFDPEKAVETASLETSQKEINWIAVSPDGKTIALISQNSITFYNNSLECLPYEHKGERVIQNAFFSQDGSRLLYSVSNAVMLLEWKNNKTFQITVENDRIYKAIFYHSAPELAYICTEGGSIYVSELNGENCMKVFTDVDESPIYDIKFSTNTDEGHLLYASNDNGVVMVYNVRENKLVRRYTLKDSSSEYLGIYSMQFLNNGEHLAIAGCDSIIRIFNINSNIDVSEVVIKGEDLVARLESHEGVNIKYLKLSGDHKFLLSVDDEYHVCVWYVVDEAIKFSKHSYPTTDMDISGDEEYLASGDGGGEVRVWNLSSAKGKLILQGHLDSVNSVRYSTDSKKILTASDDNTVRVWSASSGSGILCIDLKNNFKNNALKNFTGLKAWWTPQSREILTNGPNKSLLLWNSITGALYGKFQGASSTVTTVEFTPDQSLMVAGCSDGSIYFWEWAILASPASPPNGALKSNKVAPLSLLDLSRNPGVNWSLEEQLEGKEPLFRIINRDGTTSVTCLAFGPNSCNFAAGFSNNTIKLWKNPSAINITPIVTLDSLHKVKIGGYIKNLFFYDQDTLCSFASDNYLVFYDIKKRQIERNLFVRGSPKPNDDNPCLKVNSTREYICYATNYKTVNIIRLDYGVIKHEMYGIFNETSFVLPDEKEHTSATNLATSAFQDILSQLRQKKKEIVDFHDFRLGRKCEDFEWLNHFSFEPVNEVKEGHKKKVWDLAIDFGIAKKLKSRVMSLNDNETTVNVNRPLFVTQISGVHHSKEYFGFWINNPSELDSIFGTVPSTINQVFIETNASCLSLDQIIELFSVFDKLSTYMSSAFVKYVVDACAETDPHKIQVLFDQFINPPKYACLDLILNQSRLNDVYFWMPVLDRKVEEYKPSLVKRILQHVDYAVGKDQTLVTPTHWKQLTPFIPQAALLFPKTLTSLFNNISHYPIPSYDKTGSLNAVFTKEIEYFISNDFEDKSILLDEYSRNTDIQKFLDNYRDSKENQISIRQWINNNAKTNLQDAEQEPCQVCYVPLFQFHHSVYYDFAKASDLKLLGTQIVKSLTKFKWKAYGQKFYYGWLFMYLIYVGIFIWLTRDFFKNQTNFKFDGEFIKYLGFKGAALLMFMIVISLLMLRIESKQMLASPREYFTSPMNYVDLYVYTVPLAFTLNNFFNAKYLLPYQKAIILSVTSIAFFVELMWILQPNRELGRFVRMLYEVLKAARSFAIVLVLFLVAFWMAFQSQVLFDHHDSFLLTLYLVIIGNRDFEYVTGQLASNYTLTKMDIENGNSDGLSLKYLYPSLIALFVAFTFFVTIIMLNLLIAIVNQTFTDVSENVDAEITRSRLGFMSKIESLLAKTTAKDDRFPDWIFYMVKLEDFQRHKVLNDE